MYHTKYYPQKFGTLYWLEFAPQPYTFFFIQLYRAAFTKTSFSVSQSFIHFWMHRLLTQPMKFKPMLSWNIHGDSSISWRLWVWNKLLLYMLVSKFFFHWCSKEKRDWMEKLHSLLPQNVITRARGTVWIVCRASRCAFFLLRLVEVSLQILQHWERSFIHSPGNEGPPIFL